MQMQPRGSAGRSGPSQPGAGRGLPSQPLGGPISRPLGGPLSQPLGAGSLSQPLGAPYSRPAGGVPSQRRLHLSEAVESRIEANAARVRQRSWLFNTILLAQALITLALVPAYLIHSLDIPMLAMVGVALAVYASAFIVNRIPGKFSLALGLLIVGGGLATAAQVFVTATLGHSGAHTSQAALFFLPVVIEAGLFLSPELTLLVAAVTAALTASGILLALSLGGAASSELSGAYQVVVYALGLEALVGYMSWQLATFINEKVTEAQTVGDLRFSQARLEALQRQMGEQKRQLQRDAGQIQTAVTSMLSHEYDARVEIMDGDLAPLAESMNLLFEKLRSTNDLERKMQRMEAGVPPLVDIAERLGGAEAPGQSQSSGLMADTALYSVGVALTNAQTAQSRRLAQIFQLSSDVVDALRHNRQVLERAVTDSMEAQRQAGELVAMADTLTHMALREVEMIVQARRLLARLLPRELTETPNGERDPLYDGPISTPLATGALTGLGEDIGLLHADLPSEFDALGLEDAQSAGIAPMTLPVQALAPIPVEQEEEAPAAFAPGELPGELVNSWDLLRQVHISAAHEQRQMSALTGEMGVLSRLVRQTDANVVWVMQALDATQKRAEQAQSLSGGSNGETIDDAMGRPASSSAARRAPLATRPLGADARIADAGRYSPADVPSSLTPAPGSIRVQDLLTGSQPGPVADVLSPARSDGDGDAQ